MRRSRARAAGLILSWLLAPVGVALAGPPIFGADASPPGTARNPAKLGGHVTFNERAFEVVKTPGQGVGISPIGGKQGVPPIAGRPSGPGIEAPIVKPGGNGRGTFKSPAFTEAELIKAAPNRVQKIAQPDGSTTWMVVGRRGSNGRPLPPVPLDAYVKQLNAYETWLNGYGKSLRDGALAAGGPKSGPVKKELGLKFRLRDMEAVKKDEEGNPPPALDLIPIPDPIRDRFGPIAGQWVRADITKTAQQISTESVVFDSVPAMRGATSGPAAQWRNDVLQSVKLAPLPIVMKPMTGCPAKQCAYTLNKDLALTQFGQDVVNNVRVEQDRWCEGVMTGFGCIGTMHIVYLSWRKTLSVNTSPEALQYFLDHYKTPCDIEKYPQLKNFFFSLYKKIESSESGPITQADGDVAKSFFDGKLLFQLPYDKECLLDYSGNSWFGASACMRYSTSNIYEKTSGFDFRNSAGSRVGFTVFGMDFDLINGDASIAWKQGSPYQTPVSVTDPVTGTTLKTMDDTRYYEGPGATFAIGPIPVSISSRLQTSLSVGEPIPEFKQPPLTPGVQGQGVIGVGVGGRAQAKVGFDAGIDAYVVAAGVYGNISLLDAQLKGSIKSTIDPYNNKLRIDRGIGFYGSTLNGEIGVFAEVDVLVYSKRWEIEIASFDGINKDVPFTNKTYEASAVDPASIKPATPCK